jgi:selenocysteine lyase/cysteine desulfurase
VPASLPSQRHLFGLPDGITYLNCAYFSPKPHPVREAGLRAVTASAAPWTVGPPDFFEPGERLRASFGALIGGDPDGVAFVPSASYGMGVAAANVPLAPGRTVVVVAEEFPSDVYPWRAATAERGGIVVTVPLPGSGGWTDAVLGAIDDRTAAVVVPACHWTDGSVFDIVAIGEAARARGAALALDLSQSLGAVPFDVTEVSPDFVVSVGYKWLMGPYSFGYLWVAERYRDTGRPVEHTWPGRKGSEDFARLVDYTDEYRPGARRFDVGEFSNFTLLPMAEAALELIRAWDPARVEASIAPLTARVEEQARSIGLEPVAAERRRGHMIGIRFPEGLPEGLRERLAADRIHVSVRGSAMRVSPHLYNDEDDVDRLLAALRDLVSRA